VEAFDDIRSRSYPPAVRLLLILVAITVVLGLIYAIQYYAGSPLRLQVVSKILSLDLDPSKTTIAAGGDDGRLRIWQVPPDLSSIIPQDFDVAQETFWEVRALRGHDAPVLEVGFVPDSGTLVSVDADAQLRRWDVAIGGRLGELGLGGGPLHDAALTADAALLATLGEDGTVRIWDTASGQELQSMNASSNSQVVAFSRDGDLVAANDGENILVWDAQAGSLVQEIVGYCEDDPSASIEACKAAEDQWLGHKKAVTALAFSPDNELLASGGADTTVVFWEIETGEARWSSVGHWAAVTTMVFGEDGEFMLSGGADFKVRNLRVTGGKSTATFEGHLATVRGVVFGPLEDTIITAGDDGTLRVWETGNQYVKHLEWSRLGLQPMWGDVFGVWMLVSSLLGLLALWGLARLRIWGHLLSLGLYLVGPIVVLGLPLLEVLTYPLRFGLKLQIAWPLVVLVAWYVALLVLLTREAVALRYEAPVSASLSEQLMVSRRTRNTRLGIFGFAVWIALLVILYSILRRFNLDIAFMGSWLEFIMRGAGITFYVSAASILLAVILALVGALGRLSKNPIANSVSGFYISLIRGTPLLVQIYIWYLGLPRLDIVLPATIAGILALGVNYGAYMTEIFRAGIQAVSIGQREAAQALGMNGLQTFRRIILPQAFRIVIPPIGNEFIAMMKDSSLVSIMAVQELTWRANKVGRQYFRGMETFIIAAAFYWILTVAFQFFQGKLEDRMARGERR
jgi:polar amino acid transport system permease protein